MNSTRTLRCLIAATALTALSGCATIFSGTSHPLTVETDPQGAACDIERRGTKLTSIGATPQQVSVPKAFGALVVKCSKAEHADATGVVSAGMQPWFFANIILGGAIGMGIDLLSGAATRYESLINLALYPNAFKTPAERDEYAAKRRASIDADAAKEIAAAEKGCGPTNSCETARKTIDNRKTSRLAELDARMASVKITGQ